MNIAVFWGLAAVQSGRHLTTLLRESACLNFCQIARPTKPAVLEGRADVCETECTAGDAAGWRVTTAESRCNQYAPSGLPNLVLVCVCVNFTALSLTT